MRRVRECLVAAGEHTGPTLVSWQALPDSSVTSEACADVRMRTPGSFDGDALQLEARFAEAPSAGTYVATEYQFSYRVIEPARFELHGGVLGRRFLLDADGQLHVSSTRRRATTEDGPPEPCEIDPAKHC